MKRRSILYRGLVALVSALITVAGIHADVFAAAATVQLSAACPYPVCGNHIYASGPYADLDDVVDASVPYFGGKTYREVGNDPHIGLTSDYTKYHLYILYCSAYNRDDSSFTRHTMTVLAPQHGYSVVGYTPRDAAGHYAHLVCDHSNTQKYSLSQELCGERAMLETPVWKAFLQNDTVGCGATKDEYQSHTWTYGPWTKKSDTEHQRTKTCTLCGYSLMQTAAHGWTRTDYVSKDAGTHQYKNVCSSCGAFEYKTESHDLVYGEWQYFTNGSNNYRQHFRTVTCSKCAYETIEYANHSFRYLSEVYQPSGELHHFREKQCTVCGLQVGEYTLHEYDPENKAYDDLSDTQHRVRNTCTLCGREDAQTEDHSYTSTFESVSETKHRHTLTCVCGHTIGTEEDHHDDDNDCYCDDCGYLMTRFSVTVPAMLSLVMDRNGNVYAATNAAIYNNSTAAVKVNEIGLTAQNGWTVVPYATDMANEKVDSRLIGFKLRSDESDAGGQLPLAGDWSIGRDESLALPYDAVVSASTVPIEGETVLQATFVIDWRD